MAVFGSLDVSQTLSSSSTCSNFHVSFFSVSSLPLPRSSERFLVQMAPNMADVAVAVADSIKALQWKDQKIAMLTHPKTSQLEVSSLLSTFEERQLPLPQIVVLDQDDIRPVLASLRQKGIKHFVVDIDANLIMPFFNQALRSGLVQHGSSFFFCSLEFSFVDLDAVGFTGANVYGLKPINEQRLKQLVQTNPNLGQLASLSFGHALLYDALQLWSFAMESASMQMDVRSPQIDCNDREGNFHQGHTIKSFIANTSLEHALTSSGPARPLALVTDPESLGLKRSSWDWDIVQLQQNASERAQLVPIGLWSWTHWESYGSSSSATIDPALIRLQSVSKDDFGSNKVLHVAMEMDWAFPALVRLEMDEYKGFWPHLARELASQMGVKLVFQQFDNNQVKVPDVAFRSAPSILLNSSSLMSVTLLKSKLALMTSSRSSSLSSLMILMTSLSLSSWLALIASCIITTFAIWLVSKGNQRFGPSAPGSRSSELNDLSTFGWAQTLYFVISALTIRESHFMSSGIGLNLMRIVWMIVALLMLVFYIDNIRYNVYNDEGEGDYRAILDCSEVIMFQNELIKRIFQESNLWPSLSEWSLFNTSSLSSLSSNTLLIGDQNYLKTSSLKGQITNLPHRLTYLIQSKNEDVINAISKLETSDRLDHLRTLHFGAENNENAEQRHQDIFVSLFLLTLFTSILCILLSSLELGLSVFRGRRDRNDDIDLNRVISRPLQSNEELDCLHNTIRPRIVARPLSKR